MLNIEKEKGVGLGVKLLGGSWVLSYSAVGIPKFYI